VFVKGRDRVRDEQVRGLARVIRQDFGFEVRDDYKN
jgi:hypothetical protein